TRPAPCDSSRPTTRPRTAATNASAPHGSPRPTPKPSTRHSTTSSPASRDHGTAAMGVTAADAALGACSDVPGCRDVWFGRRRPSPQTLRWVERSLAGTARVVAWRRMTGGIVSVVHRLTIDHGGYRNVLVLRQYEHADSDAAAQVRHEAATLHAVHDAG